MSASDTGTDFTVTMLVDRTPDEVFAAINDVRGWWSGEIEGETDRPGAQFTYRYADVHRSVQRITEMVPGRKVVWRVVDSHLDFLVDKSEWTGTDIVFEIADRQGQTEVRFTHRGLSPHIECYDSCSNAWGALLNRNLRASSPRANPSRTFSPEAGSPLWLRRRKTVELRRWRPSPPPQLVLDPVGPAPLTSAGRRRAASVSWGGRARPAHSRGDRPLPVLCTPRRGLHRTKNEFTICA